MVVDRPNVLYQDDAKYATRIVKKILTEVLPYLNIFMTEELSDKEREELEQLQIQIRMPQNPEEAAEEEEIDEEGNPIPKEPQGEEGASGEGGQSAPAEGEGSAENPEEEANEPNEAWKDLPLDPETGYLVDPTTGAYLDPQLGTVIGGGSLMGDSIGAPPASEPSGGENEPPI